MTTMLPGVRAVSGGYSPPKTYTSMDLIIEYKEIIKPFPPDLDHSSSDIGLVILYLPAIVNYLDIDKSNAGMEMNILYEKTVFPSKLNDSSSAGMDSLIDYTKTIFSTGTLTDSSSARQQLIIFYEQA